jgi:hypothetical protein
VIVRVLATLITLGLLAAAVDARALDTPVTAALSITIDGCDDGADLELVVPVGSSLDDDCRPLAALITSESPPRYEHCRFVFRPPRAYALN